MISLHNEFRVGLPIDATWDLLTDLPKVARCLPGANLDEVVEGEYRGGLSTRIGPISAKYRGVASFLEHDQVGHRAVIEAHGREEKGSGSAKALITAVLKPDGDGTLVDVATELAISGKAAQFGRSLLAEVSSTMVGEFVRRLESMIESGETAGVGESADVSDEQPAPAFDDAEQLDVVRTIILPMLRKAAVPAAAAVVSGVVGVLIGRRGRSTGSTLGGIPVMYVLPYPGRTLDG